MKFWIVRGTQNQNGKDYYVYFNGIHNNFGILMIEVSKPYLFPQHLTNLQEVGKVLQLVTKEFPQFDWEIKEVEIL